MRKELPPSSLPANKAGSTLRLGTARPSHPRTRVVFNQYFSPALLFTYPPTHQLDIRNLTLTLGNREILSGADLKLQYGIHYVVVGRNGVGKSSCVCLLSLSSCLI